MKTVYGLKIASNELDVCVKEGNVTRQLRPLGVYADNFSDSPYELAYVILFELFSQEKANAHHKRFAEEVLFRWFNKDGYGHLFKIAKEDIEDWLRLPGCPAMEEKGDVDERGSMTEESSLSGSPVREFLNKVAVQARINRIAHGDSPRPVMEWAVIAGTHMGHLLEAAMKGDGDTLEKEILHVAAPLLELYVEAVKAGVTG